MRQPVTVQKVQMQYSKSQLPGIQAGSKVLLKSESDAYPGERPRVGPRGAVDDVDVI